MRRVGVLLVGVLTLLVTACGGGPAPAPPPAFDPPTAFGPSSGTLLRGTAGSLTGSYGVRPELPVALDGTTIWLADSGGLARADSTGAAVAVPLPPDRWVAGAPRPVPAAGLVVAAAASTVPGSGTTPPGLALELLAVPRSQAGEPDPTLAFSVGAPLPWSEAPRSVRTAVAGVAVVGVGRRVAVLTAATSTRRSTVAVDLDARRVLWVADGVLAGAVVDGRAPDGAPPPGTPPVDVPVAVGAAVPPGGGAGYSPSSVVGLDVDSGARRWSADDGSTALSVHRAGPGTVTVAGRRPTSARAFLTVYDAGGGARNGVDLGTATAPPECTWDEAATTVCSGSNRTFALDAPTGAVLWSLPAGGRVAPAVTTAWHGAVYGTTVNGPVVVDARTGRDRNPAPGAAPVVVDAYLGVGAGAGLLGGVVVTPATG
ncbi:PQQ-like beta-propeller repeat protein [Actinomycetospora soli]|uniref:PQQ-like beta-propeller repeat protein n=1 Tax=Actinomycetospora soli TaxID=2893887 RepID=UPI001E4A9CB2|nr:PQQ-like beta-propeller repeat protein [Actinomycetospora soli]MCD2190162.1 PQQ-like beta-propeller repeat protein [Actinomycetospora soli]